MLKKHILTKKMERKEDEKNFIPYFGFNTSTMYINGNSKTSKS